jgi:hypothetical protein
MRRNASALKGFSEKSHRWGNWDRIGPDVSGDRLGYSRLVVNTGDWLSGRRVRLRTCGEIRPRGDIEHFAFSGTFPVHTESIPRCIRRQPIDLDQCGGATAGANLGYLETFILG